MKSIIFIPAFLIATIYSFAQTLHLPEIISENSIHHISLSDKKYANTNSREIKELLFSGEGDIIDSTQYWTWNRDTGKWDLTERIFYTTDLNGNLLMQVTLVRNGLEWMNSFREVSTYDENNNELTELNQGWNGSAWDNVRLTTNVYDSENNRTSRTIQIWDGTMWVNTNHLLFTYDDHHNILTRTTGIWLGTEWSNGVRTVYTYDDDHHLILQEVQHWDGVEYLTDQQVLYFYTPEGDLDTSLTQSWETDHWEDVSRNIYEYDDNHNITLYLTQKPSGNDVWDDEQRFIYTYDSDNNITSQLYQVFIVGVIGGVWINEYQFLAEYDTRQNRITEVFQVWEDEWVSQDSFHFYYTLATGIADVLKLETMQLYPNPVSSTLSIDFASDHLPGGTFTIFSANGISVMEGEVNDLTKTTIDVSKMMPGYYFILINGINGSAVRQVIKLQD